MRSALSVVLLPFWAVLAVPVRLILRIVSAAFILSGLGALVMLPYTGSWREVGGIWVCGAVALLLRVVAR